MGSNLLLVRPGAPNQRGFNNTATLVLADVKAIDEEVPNVLAAVPEQQSNATLRYEGRDYSTQVNGTSSKFPQARQWKVAKGAFFTADDEADYATVAVLGRTVADALFPDGEDPLGKFVVVNNVIFQVTGVMAVRGRLAHRPGPGRRGAGALRHQPAAPVGPALPAQRPRWRCRT